MAKVVNDYFTFGFALFFAVLGGVIISFTGSQCEGKISSDSPVYYCLLLVAAGLSGWIYITIQLTLKRLIRLAGVALGAQYLAHQAYGFYSIRFIDSALACHPYGWANEFYGHIMIHAPVAGFMFICLFVWKKEIFFQT